MSFTLQRSGINLVKKPVTVATVPNTTIRSSSVGSTGNTAIATLNTLSINNNPITQSAEVLNKLNTSFGIAEEDKPLLLDNSRNISGLSNLSCTKLIVNGTEITADLYSSSGTDDANNPLISNTTAGIASESKALILDSNKSIKSINSLGTNNIKINNTEIYNKNSVSTNINLSEISNTTLSNTNSILNSRLFGSNGWVTGGAGNSAMDDPGSYTVCWSPELGIFISINGNGLILKSTNGLYWEVMSTSLNQEVRDLCWSSDLNLFVSCAATGTNRIAYSSDGTTWTSVNVSTIALYSVIWVSELSLFIAGGNATTILRSSNGIDWILCNTRQDTGITFNTICWASELNLLVAGGTGGGRILISYDGIDWVVINDPNILGFNITNIVWSPELKLFVATTTANNRLMYSYNGFKWYFRQMTNVFATIDEILWIHEFHAFLGYNNKKSIIYSYDGISWSSIENTAESSSYGLPGAMSWSAELGTLVIVMRGLNSGYYFNKIMTWITPIYAKKPALTVNPYNFNIKNNNIGINNNNPLAPLDINTINSNALKITRGNLRSSTNSLEFNLSSNGKLDLKLNGAKKNFIIPTDYVSYGLKLNNTVITANVNTLNNLKNILAGTALASTALCLDSSRNISGINVISCNSLIINNNPITTSTNNQYLTDNPVGVTTANKAIIADKNNNIVGINQLTVSRLKINENDISMKNTLNYNYLKNKINRPENIDLPLTNWTAVLNTIPSKTANDIIWCKELSIFVALVGQQIATSSNGYNWTYSSSLGNLKNIAWSPELSLFIVMPLSGFSYWISQDGINWKVSTLMRVNGATVSYRKIIWCSDLGFFLAIIETDGYDLMISKDGLSWNYANIEVSGISDVIWISKLKLFILSDNSLGLIYYSSNGTNWTIAHTKSVVTSGATPAVTPFLAWSDELNLCISVAANTILYSNDGINWGYQANSNLTGSIFNSLDWISDLGIFIGLSNGTNYVMYSYNGFIWYSLKPNISNTSFTSNPSNISRLAYSDKLKMLAITITHSNTPNSWLLVSDYFDFTNENSLLTLNNNFKVHAKESYVGLGVEPTNYQLELSRDSAAKPSTSTWTVASDEILKENIENADLELCYNNIKQLDLKRYKWKHEVYTQDEVKDRTKLGWIAQDVEQIFPKAVSTTNKYNYEDCKTLNIDQIIASMYGAAQQLINNYEAQEIAINDLNNKLNNIDSTLNQLEIIEETV